MNQSKRFSFTSRINSFKFAFNGIMTLLKEEPNAFIHCILAVLVVCVSYLLNISQEEWLFIILAIVLVIGAEAFNTAIETLSDFVQPEKHEAIKKVKDLSAAAVLIISVGAFVGGLIIFVPKLIHLIS